MHKNENSLTNDQLKTEYSRQTLKQIDTAESFITKYRFTEDIPTSSLV